FSLATDLIARIHCDSNDTILIEEPSQPSLKNVLLSYGANLHPVAIDNSGLQTDELPDWDDYSKLKLAFCTPSHQIPSGSIMPLSRRAQLLDWAERSDVLVVETDYDSDYVAEGRAIPAMKSM